MKRSILNAYNMRSYLNILSLVKYGVGKSRVSVTSDYYYLLTYLFLMIYEDFYLDLYLL